MIIEQDKRSAALPVKPPVRKQFSDLPPVEHLEREREPSPVPELVLPDTKSNTSPHQASTIETKPQEEVKSELQLPIDQPAETETVQEQPRSESLDQNVSVGDRPTSTSPTPTPKTEISITPVSEEEDKSFGNIQDLSLTESLSATDITRLMTIICNYIENLEEPLIVKKSYYAASNPSSSSNLTKKKIEIAIDAASLDELQTENNEDIPPEVLSWIVLKFAEEKGSYLLPRSVVASFLLDPLPLIVFFQSSVKS